MRNLIRFEQYEFHSLCFLLELYQAKLRPCRLLLPERFSVKYAENFGAEVPLYLVELLLLQRAMSISIIRPPTLFLLDHV